MTTYRTPSGRRLGFPGPDTRAWAAGAFSLVPASAFHLHVASASAISSAGPSIAPAGAFHLHFAAQPAVGIMFSLAPDSAFHPHVAGAGTVTPEVLAEPLAAPRSIEFMDRNGMFGRKQYAAFPALTNIFRTGSALQDGVFGITVWQLHQGMRNNGGSTSTADTRSAQSVIIANGANESSGSIYLGYYGANHGTTARRNRFYVRLVGSGPISITALSEEWIPEEPVRVLIISEAGGIRIDLIKMDGTVLTGAPTLATAATGGTFVGVSSMGAGRIGADTDASANGITEAAKSCAVADWFYARRAPSAGDRIALAAGTPPTDIFTGVLDFHYRMSGTADLAKTAGSVSLAALTLGVDGGASPLPVSGPSIWYNPQATKKVWAKAHQPGYVAGHAWNGPYRANLPVYITNGGGGATHMQARACVYQDGQTTWKAWTRVTATPLADGATVLVDLPDVNSSDWLTIEVRREDDITAKSCTWRCGVGPKVVLADGQSTAEIPAGTIPTSSAAIHDTLRVNDSLVSACINQSRVGFSGNTVHAILNDAGQVGSGFHGFSLWWKARCDALGVRRVAHVMNMAVAGEARFQWYEDNILNGSYRFTGDLVTAGTGRVTDVLLKSCARTTERDITAFFYKPGSSDLDIQSQLQIRTNAWYLGSDTTGDGRGTSGAPARHVGQFNLLHPLRVLYVLTPRFLSTGTENDSAAEQATTATRLSNWRDSMLTTFTNATYSKGWAVFSNDLAFDEAPAAPDKVHHGTLLAAGTPRFYGRMALDVAELAGLISYEPRILPPSTFAINGPRDTITVTFTPQNGGTLGTGDAGATVGGMEISTDGGTTWEMIDGTLSGNVVTYTGSWAAVSDANLRMRFLRGRFPAVVAASTSTADLQASIAAENLLLPRHLYESFPGLPYAGIPVWRSEANMVPA